MANDDENELPKKGCADKDISIGLLGQRLCIPANIWSFFIITSLFVAVYAILWLVLKHPRETQSFYHTIAGRFGQDTRPVEHEKSTIYSFWTPSEDTEASVEDYLTKLGPEDQAESEKINKRLRDGWYSTTNEKLALFGKKLMSWGAQGFSRWESWGEGTAGLKPGWTWEVTIPDDQEFSRRDLQRLYADFFNRREGVYIEVERAGPAD